jgi:hypothetical protein
VATSFMTKEEEEEGQTEKFVDNTIVVPNYVG